MVDYTTLGVAGLGLIGTLGAGVIGFAGPSWNEKRIQAATDARDARRALRLVALEIELNCSAVESFLLASSDGVRVAEVFDVTSATAAAWSQHRDVLATTIDDQATWEAVARFYAGREFLKAWASQTTVRKGDERVPEHLGKLVAGGRNAIDRLKPLLRGTNTAQGEADSV